MREIKFRVWDIDNKTWVFVTLNDLVCGACTIRGDKPLSGGSQVWEQYTGLKDINSTEIYEGDILMDDTDVPTEYWVVKFFNGVFVGECVNIVEHLFELTDLEVASNIHENPELLEEK